MIINLKLWCNDNRMGVGFSMMKRLLLAVIVMFACVGGVVLSPKDGNFVFGRAEAVQVYTIPKYLNNDPNWPCIWPGGNVGTYMDVSSVVSKDGWQYYIEASVNNNTDAIFGTNTVAVKRKGDMIYTKGNPHGMPIDVPTPASNAWKIINGFAR